MKIIKIIFYNFILILLFLVQVSCSNKGKSDLKQNKQAESKIVTKRVSVIKINSPKSGEMFTVGDLVEVAIGLKKSEIKIDSIIADTQEGNFLVNLENLKFVWDTKNLKVGNNQLKIYAYSGGDKVDRYSLNLKFKSDIKPELYECEVVNTYPHDNKAYTQGLFYEKGVMFEGTGQRGESSLRKVRFETGELISVLSLENKYFGEGITEFKDKIIQLTWTSRTGFVYDKNSFKLIATLRYPTQGWGITNDGEKLIMSDGTQTIHFLDPEYFNEIDKIEVYDNEGSVRNLNELEYINGLVYANVYQTEEIIAFDPISGKVLKRFDCRKIIPKGYQGETDNVLNGIAYDKDNDRIFITGKRWPSLFEVKFIKK